MQKVTPAAKSAPSVRESAAPGSSLEDRQTILNEAAHIPDRDQTFHRGRVDSWAEAQEADLEGWSPDLETQVTGEDAERDVERRLVFPRRDDADGDRRHPSSRPGALPRNGSVARDGARSLDAGDLKRIEHLLESRRADLESVIVAKQRLVREQLSSADDGASHIDFNHPADMVVGDGDYEREILLLRGERAELTSVNQALSRLKEGRFGLCESCGETMRADRLLAMPDARLCVACQGKVETARAASAVAASHRPSDASFI